MRRLLFLLALGGLLCGCRSYEIVQSNVFSDDDGFVVRVNYGRSADFHKNTFLNPATGKRTEFLSKLVVDIVMPDGESFTAWQCMNFQQSGTMYKTDNEKWLVLVTGFTAAVGRQTEEDPTQYLEVFRGVLCDSPKVNYEPNKKWRTLKKNAQGKWK